MPLDEVGRAQAAAVAPELAALRPVALWTSDLARARETAAYVEAATGLTAVVDARLREYDLGERTGMTMPEYAASPPTSTPRSGRAATTWSPAASPPRPWPPG